MQSIRFRADLHQFDQMSSELLRTLTTTDLDPQKATFYEELLDKNQREGLTADEQHTLDSLREEADLLMFRRAYAASQLKWRDSNKTVDIIGKNKPQINADFAD